MENKVDECGLGLAAADAKPRLKWTRQLHQRFVNAVSQLGGPHKATPKSVMRVMGIPGITLHHLKSHLQKYRVAKNRDHKADNKTEDYRPTCIDENGTQTQFQNSRTTLQFQIEVQNKLQEQLEVQKHLQLRIEAQGKYLQSVLRKAQETLASYSLNCVDMEAANLEISELVSSVDAAECPSSPFPPAAACSIVSKQFLSADRSTDSCLTSAEGPELRNAKQNNSLETSESSNSWSAESNEIIFLGGKNVTSMHQIEIDLNR